MCLNSFESTKFSKIAQFHNDPQVVKAAKSNTITNDTKQKQ